MAITATNIERTVVGDLVVVTADLAGVANNLTWTVPHIGSIRDPVDFRCTTDDDAGATTSGNVITFKAGATIAGAVRVWGK